ncbi:MAG: hypothetical protein GXO91_00835 [FCB group bacterium]|nr:hypothetical protein [FCB group bacterium]
MGKCEPKRAPAVKLAKRQIDGGADWRNNVVIEVCQKQKNIGIPSGTSPGDKPNRLIRYQESADG